MQEAARFVPERLEQLDGYDTLSATIADLQVQLAAQQSKTWNRFPAVGQPIYRITQAQIDAAVAANQDHLRINFPLGTKPYPPGADALFVTLGGVADQIEGDVFREVAGGMAIDILLNDLTGDLQVYDRCTLRVRWFA